MKSLMIVCSLALAGWLVPPQSAPAVVATELAPVDATVTGSGEVVSVSLLSPHTLRFSAWRGGGASHFDLELSTLPADRRLVAARLGAFGTHGLAVALALQGDADTEYRWLFTTGDPLRGQLWEGDLGAAMTASRGTSPDAPWSLSAPLFTSTGEPYRLVDIHNPGGDSLELTFRRGALQGVRQREDGFAVDERIVHDICPMPNGGPGGFSVQAIVERVVPSP